MAADDGIMKKELIMKNRYLIFLFLPVIILLSFSSCYISSAESPDTLNSFKINIHAS